MLGKDLEIAYQVQAPGLFHPNFKGPNQVRLKAVIIMFSNLRANVMLFLSSGAGAEAMYIL
jgi:hypothetical protein